tara:strand:- start:265 stop:411 length:147 start_codon:yes stop_codon:yes gene_type:complete
MEASGNAEREYRDSVLSAVEEEVEEDAITADWDDMSKYVNYARAMLDV